MVGFCSFMYECCCYILTKGQLSVTSKLKTKYLQIEILQQKPHTNVEVLGKADTFFFRGAQPLWFQLMTVGFTGEKRLVALEVNVSKQELHYRFLHLNIMVKIQMQPL